MRTEITKAIKELRGQYIDKGVSSYFEINNGKCEDFAEDLVRSLETKCDAGKMFVVENGNFCLNGDCFGGKWDWKLLDEWGIASPQGLACSEVDNIDFGAHVWAVIDGRHYDAESPEGVESFFDLPIFRRPIIMALRKKRDMHGRGLHGRRLPSSALSGRKPDHPRLSGMYFCAGECRFKTDSGFQNE